MRRPELPRAMAKRSYTSATGGRAIVQDPKTGADGLPLCRACTGAYVFGESNGVCSAVQWRIQFGVMRGKFLRGNKLARMYQGVDHCGVHSHKHGLYYRLCSADSAVSQSLFTRWLRSPCEQPRCLNARGKCKAECESIERTASLNE